MHKIILYKICSVAYQRFNLGQTRGHVANLTTKTLKFSFWAKIWILGLSRPAKWKKNYLGVSGPNKTIQTNLGLSKPT